jgi:hypothetical protein
MISGRVGPKENELVEFGLTFVLKAREGRVWDRPFIRFTYLDGRNDIKFSTGCSVYTFLQLFLQRATPTSAVGRRMSPYCKITSSVFQVLAKRTYYQAKFEVYDDLIPNDNLHNAR